MTAKTYAELDSAAEIVAYVTAVHINRIVHDIESEMPYKAQYVLEKVIELLRARV